MIIMLDLSYFTIKCYVSIILLRYALIIISYTLRMWILKHLSIYFKPSDQGVIVAFEKRAYWKGTAVAEEVPHKPVLVL